MAFTLVQSAEGTSSLATVTASFAVAPTNGNLIILTIASETTNAGVASGWTESTGNNVVSYHEHLLWWRIASGGVNSFPVAMNGAFKTSWYLQEISGAAASPYNTSAGQYNQATASSMTTPTIVPSAGPRLLIASLAGVTSDSFTDSSLFEVTGWLNSFTNIGSSCEAGLGSNRHFTSLAYRTVTGDAVTTFSTGGDMPGAFASQSGLIISFLPAPTNTLDAAQGTFLVTGQAALFRQALSMAAAQGSFGITGIAANLTASTISFDFSGIFEAYEQTYFPGVPYQDNTPFSDLFNYTLTADQGVYTLTGVPANLSYTATSAGAYSLVASPGSFSIIGQSANLLSTTDNNNEITLRSNGIAFTVATVNDFGLFAPDGSVYIVDATRDLTEGLFNSRGNLRVRATNVAFPS
jgi:hypothetical protein